MSNTALPILPTKSQWISLAEVYHNCCEVHAPYNAPAAEKLVKFLKENFQDYSMGEMDADVLGAFFSMIDMFTPGE